MKHSPSGHLFHLLVLFTSIIIVVVFGVCSIVSVIAKDKLQREAEKAELIDCRNAVLKDAK